MPSAEKHERQYKANKELLMSPVFNADTTKYRDWLITISFYCALHLVEKKLYELLGMDTKEHKVRNKLIIRASCFTNIATQYSLLYNESLRARYKCHSFSEEDVYLVLSSLKDIENELA